MGITLTLFRCHSSTAGHRIVLAYNCLEVAAKLGRYHRAVRRLQPGEELPDWIPAPEIPAGDSRLNYVDAFTLLGDAMHPMYRHPKALARAYDHVYYEGWEIGNLPLRGKKTVDQSAAVYRAEYAQILHRFSTLARIDCEKFVRPMPTSMVHPEMVYPNKKYELYYLKVLESGPVAQYEPVSSYKMDGLQPRIDLRPDTEVPIYPEDEVDTDPRFNEYPLEEEFVEGPAWSPAGSLLKYVPQNTLAAPVTLVWTPRQPVPCRPCQSLLIRNHQTERPPPCQLGVTPVRWNLLPSRV